jgi:cold shock CspA family protein
VVTETTVSGSAGCMTTTENITQFGLVKWFGNERTQGQYGFIKDTAGTDHFFHGRSIVERGYSPEENNAVVFELVPSKKRPGQFDADRVRPLWSLNDLDFLVSAYVETEYSNTWSRIIGAVGKRIGRLVSSDDEKVAVVRRVTYPDSQDSESAHYADTINELLVFVADAFSAERKDILEMVLGDFPLSVQYQVWRAGHINWHSEFMHFVVGEWLCLPPTGKAYREPIYCLLCLCKSGVAGLVPRPLPPHSKFRAEAIWSAAPTSDLSSRCFQVEFLLELRGQPGPDEGLVGHRLHGGELLDGLYLYGVQLQGDALQLVAAFPIQYGGAQFFVEAEGNLFLYELIQDSVLIVVGRPVLLLRLFPGTRFLIALHVLGLCLL